MGYVIEARARTTTGNIVQTARVEGMDECEKAKLFAEEMIYNLPWSNELTIKIKAFGYKP